MRKAVLITLAVTGMLAWAIVPAYALTVDADTGIDMVNSNVYALAASPDGWIYVGGKFDEIKSSTGKNRCPADELIRLDEASGTADCSWTPAIPSGSVFGVAVNGGYVYAGGTFGLVRVSVSTGQVDSSFSVTVKAVRAVTADPNGTGVYIGGAFNRVNGKSHHGIAHINGDGTLDSSFQGDLEGGRVSRIRISPNGYLVASGSFDTADGQHEQSIAELDETTGAANLSFSPVIPEDPMQCFDTAPTSTDIYAACGQKHNFMAEFDASTGAVVWRQGLGGNGESISMVSPTEFFVGGHMGTRDPSTQPCGSNYLHGIFKMDDKGNIDCSWDPLLMPDVNNYTGGWVQELVNGHLWLGGRFSTVDGVAHHGIARWTL